MDVSAILDNFLFVRLIPVIFSSTFLFFSLVICSHRLFSFFLFSVLVFFLYLYLCLFAFVLVFVRIVFFLFNFF